MSEVINGQKHPMTFKSKSHTSSQFAVTITI